MIRYIGKRFLLMIPVLLGITIISFGVMKIAPGDPTSLYTDLNPNINEEAIKRIRAHYGLDEPSVRSVRQVASKHDDAGLWKIFCSG